MMTRCGRIAGAAMVAAAVLFLRPAGADALTMRIEATGVPPVDVIDNGAGDLDPTVGVIVFIGPIGPFTSQTTTGISKPVVGSALLAELDLSSVASTRISGGTLVVTLTDTGYSFVPPATAGVDVTSAVGGTTSGSTEYQSWLDACSPGLQGPFTGAFDDEVSAYCEPEGSFMLTARAATTIGANSVESFGATIMAVPRQGTCEGSIGDLVWYDLNRNGIQDLATEGGINDVLVTLKDSANTVIATTTTGVGPSGQDGYYQFTGLCAGDYTVEVATPAGYLPTASQVGTDRSIDSNGSPAYVNLPTDNSSDQTIDFGFYVPVAAIGDRVWEDLNRNGIQDGGEPGVPGVTVNLYTCTGVFVATTATDASGYYLFGGLMPGDYYVEFVAPAGYVFSPRDQGADDALDSDADQTSGLTACTTLSPDETDLTWDAGIYCPQAPGTGTPGYWKNHPDAWPVAVITIGGVTYTKAQAIAIMGWPDGDKTVTMFRSLVAAKLNVLVGNESSCIAGTIVQADAWMATYGPVGSGVGAKSVAWKRGEPLYLMLDAYNNGLLCAPSRDYMGDPHVECPPLTEQAPTAPVKKVK